MRGDRAALITAGGSVDYRERSAQARVVAGALARRGVSAGDRVALALPSEELVVALHGCLLLGAVAVPIDLRLTEAEQTLRGAHASVLLDALPAERDDAAPV